MELPQMKFKLTAALVSVGLMAGMNSAYAQDNPDPWQGFNRAMFSFNETIDKYAVKPLAKGYQFIMPDPLERGVDNVFSNISEVPNTLNGLLQGDFKGAAHDTGRLLVNTTLGIGGLFDVAKHMHLAADEGEDFGQTLAVWGVGQGPYLVLPFLGPSTVRDGVGKPVDWYSDPVNYIDHVRTENTVKFIQLMSLRASLFPLEENITGDRYTFIRDVYLQRREFLIKNGEVEDDFGAEDFGSDTFDENTADIGGGAAGANTTATLQ